MIEKDSRALLNTWNITLKDYESGSWGNLLGNFKVPKSIARAYYKTIKRYSFSHIANYQNYRFIGEYEIVSNFVPNDKILDITDVNVLEPKDLDMIVVKDKVYLFTHNAWNLLDVAVPQTNANGNFIFDIVIDKYKIFQELSLIYIHRLHAMFPFLRKAGILRTHEFTRNYLKEAVLAGVQYALVNKNLLEALTGTQTTGSGISITVDYGFYDQPLQSFGQRGMDLIRQSEIDNYGVGTYEDALTMVRTENGNLTFLGKFDPEFVPDVYPNYEANEPKDHYISDFNQVGGNNGKK